MLLYGVPLSPFVRKTLFTLYELDMAFDQKLVVPGDDTTDFRETSPLGRIPGFEDGDCKLSDSSAICHYLIRRQNSGLIPYDNPQALARIVGWDKYADEDIEPAVSVPLLERVVKPVRFGTLPDEDEVSVAVTQKIPPVLAYLESRLALAGAPWLAGRDFSYADIAVGAHMSTVFLADIKLYSAHWPMLSVWFDRLKGRPAFQRLCQDVRDFRP